MATVALLLLTTFLGTGLQVSLGAPSQRLRVALLLPGSINDGGWNQTAYVGLRAAERKYNLEVDYQESVPFPQFAAAMRDYAQRGYNMIIGHGGQFTGAATQVAPSFPRTAFLITSSQVRQPPNLGSIAFRNGERGYLAGYAAGLLTTTNVVGAAAAIEVPQMTDWLAGFRMGAAAAKPGITVLTAFIGDWEDGQRGFETAVSFVNRRADVVACQANAACLGMIRAAQERRIKVVGGVGDDYRLAPQNVVVSALIKADVVLDIAIGSLVQGTFAPVHLTVGLREGVHGYSPLYSWANALPSAVVEAMREVVSAILAGQIRGWPTTGD